MKILVVEDDVTLAQNLCELLTFYNYEVEVANDGRDGLELAEAFAFSLILLDVWLPNVNGLSICQHLRNKGLMMPLLLLTVEADCQKKVEALNLGADDYVVKPFDIDELMARIHALLRRGGARSQPILSWGGVSVDPNSRRVFCHGNSVYLSPKEYVILTLFLRNTHQVFSSKVILERLWSSTKFPGEEVVRAHIKGLRKKLSLAGAPHDFIKTAHRVGYQLNPLYQASPLSSINDAPVSLPESNSRTLQAGPSQFAGLQSKGQQPRQKSIVDSTVQTQEMEDLEMSKPELMHQLNNFLAAIVSSAQLLQLSHKDLNAATKKQLTQIEENARLSASIAKRLLL